MLPGPQLFRRRRACAASEEEEEEDASFPGTIMIFIQVDYFNKNKLSPPPPPPWFDHFSEGENNPGALENKPD